MKILNCNVFISHEDSYFIDWEKTGVLLQIHFFYSILKDTWVVADISLPMLNKLYVYGTLELEHKPDSSGNYMDFVLNCSHILVMGGRLIVGWEEEAFQGHAKIILRGDHYSEDMPLPGGPNVGAKAIGMWNAIPLVYS